MDKQIEKPKENLALPAPSLKTWNGVKIFSTQFIDGFSRHDVMTLAAALAFYTSFSMAPLLIITLAIVGVMGGHAQELLVQQIQSLIGDQASTAVTAIIESTKAQPQSSGFAGLVGIFLLFFSASGVFAQFESSLNVILDVEPKSSDTGVWGWIRKRLLSVGLVISLGFIALVSLLVSTLLAFFLNDSSQAWGFVNTVVSISIFAGLFSLIFKFLPDTELRWKQALTGGFVTAILFAGGKSLIGIYLGKSAVGSAYGAAGSLAVLLSWIYYSSIIVFSGAELTRILKARSKNEV